MGTDLLNQSSEALATCPVEKFSSPTFGVLNDLRGLALHNSDGRVGGTCDENTLESRFALMEKL